jgi:hypothetical protein
MTLMELMDRRSTLLHQLANDVGTMYSLVILLEQQLQLGTQAYKDVMEIKVLSTKCFTNFTELMTIEKSSIPAASKKL